MTNLIEEKIRKEFDEIEIKMFLAHLQQKDCQLKDFLEYLNERLKDIRLSTLQEVLDRIIKVKVAVEKRQGTYKYSSCYEDCEQIINQMKDE